MFVRIKHTTNATKSNRPSAYGREVEPTAVGGRTPVAAAQGH
jgi:hypothetical protein